MAVADAAAVAERAERAAAVREVPVNSRLRIVDQLLERFQNKRFNTQLNSRPGDSFRDGLFCLRVEHDLP